MYRLKISCTDGYLFRQRRVDPLHHETVPLVSVFLDLYSGFQKKSIFCKAVPYCVKCSLWLKASKNKFSMLSLKLCIRNSGWLELICRSFKRFY